MPCKKPVKLTKGKVTMDNLKDETKRHTNSAEASDQSCPDPIVQANDNSNRSGEGIQPEEIVLGTKRPISIAGETFRLTSLWGRINTGRLRVQRLNS